MAAILFLGGCRAPSDTEVLKVVHQLLQEADSPHQKVLRHFYSGNEARLIWTRQDELTERADAFISHLCEASRHGLSPADYDLERLEEALRAAYLAEPHSPSSHVDQVAALEIALSETFLHHARDLAGGRIDPGSMAGKWYLRQKPRDLAPLLEAASEVGVTQTLDSLAAQHAGYESLRKALLRYRQIEQAGGWPILSEGEPLRGGMTGQRVATLRQRLAVSGDLYGADSSSGYSEAITEAVQRFQRRHGLNARGVVDDEVIAALNVPVQERIRQIELNLERHRRLPASLGKEHIRVNIPDYHLTAYRNEKPALEMAVIVGEQMHQTPAFADTMEYVVFSPYWNVPPGIAIDEILPHAENDPSYLAHNNFEVVSGGRGRTVAADGLSEESLERGVVHIRQKPGSDNALGDVKFMFPNDHDIYLHDTPSDHLFDLSARGFSHGCIRVERPVDLARFVLPTDAWPANRIQEAMQRDEPEQVNLPRPLPVYIVYLTAWTDDEGIVHFREDVYGHDTTLQELIGQRRSSQRSDICTALRELVDELK